MGKKTKAVPAKKLVTPTLPAETQQQFAAIKEAGNRYFTENQYLKAVEEYDRARVIAHSSSDAVDLALRKSACFYKLKRFKDSVKECDVALGVQPNHATALKRRAQSYEQLGLLKNALSDYQRVNRTESGTDDTRASEKRLKEVMTGKKSSSDVLGMSRGLQRQAARSNYQQFTVKCTLGNDSRLVHITPTTTYGELLQAVHSKFPESGPVVLKYVDREGDLVTITQRLDIQRALTELIASTDRQALSRQQVPALRLEVVPVADQSAVPPPPPEEEIERQQLQAKLLEDLLKNKALANQGAEAAPAAAANGQPGEVYELDEWLSDFIDLFAQVTNIDPFRSEHLSNLGQEETQRGIRLALQKEESVPILRKAAERFKEATCSGLLQWGNTHVYLASKLQETGDKSPENVAAIAAEMKEAEAKYTTSLMYKPDFWEGLCSMGHLEFERAKVAAGLIFKSPSLDSLPEEGATNEEAEKQLQEVNDKTTAALKEALLKLDDKAVAAAQPHFEKSNEWFAKAYGVVNTPAAEADKAAEGEKAEGEKAEGEEQKVAEGEEKAAEGEEKAADGAKADAANGVAAKAEQAPAGPDAQYQPGEQVQIMHGNTLYEWSQILAAVGKDWRPTLDDALAKFRKAGCSEADVRTALKNHTQSEQLDLGPDPEPEKEAEKEKPAEEEKAAAPKAAAEVAEKKLEAKGLPALEVRKKKAAAA